MSTEESESETTKHTSNLDFAQPTNDDSDDIHKDVEVSTSPVPRASLSDHSDGEEVATAVKVDRKGLECDFEFMEGGTDLKSDEKKRHSVTQSGPGDVSESDEDVTLAKSQTFQIAPSANFDELMPGDNDNIPTHQTDVRLAKSQTFQIAPSANFDELMLGDNVDNPTYQTNLKNRKSQNKPTLFVHNGLDDVISDERKFKSYQNDMAPSSKGNLRSGNIQLDVSLQNLERSCEKNLTKKNSSKLTPANQSFDSSDGIKAVEKMSLFEMKTAKEIENRFSSLDDLIKGSQKMLDIHAEVIEACKKAVEFTNTQDIIKAPSHNDTLFMDRTPAIYYSPPKRWDISQIKVSSKRLTESPSDGFPKISPPMSSAEARALATSLSIKYGFKIDLQPNVKKNERNWMNLTDIASSPMSPLSKHTSHVPKYCSENKTTEVGDDECSDSSCSSDELIMGPDLQFRLPSSFYTPAAPKLPWKLRDSRGFARLSKDKESPDFVPRVFFDSVNTLPKVQRPAAQLPIHDIYKAHKDEISMAEEMSDVDSAPYLTSSEKLFNDYLYMKPLERVQELPVHEIKPLEHVQEFPVHEIKQFSSNQGGYMKRFSDKDLNEPPNLHSPMKQVPEWADNKLEKMVDAPSDKENTETLRYQTKNSTDEKLSTAGVNVSGSQSKIGVERKLDEIEGRMDELGSALLSRIQRYAIH